MGYFLSAWHRWYAWYPVRLIDGRLVWLQRVERRIYFGAYDNFSTYRLPE